MSEFYRMQLVKEQKRYIDQVSCRSNIYTTYSLPISQYFCPACRLSISVMHESGNYLLQCVKHFESMTLCWWKDVKTYSSAYLRVNIGPQVDKFILPKRK